MINFPVLTVVNDKGAAFNVRYMVAGDKYGLNDCLTVGDDGDDRPQVEFYDAEYAHTCFGQFVSRYYAHSLTRDYVSGETIANRGLDLMGYEPKWKIDAATMAVVRKWIIMQSNIANNEAKS